jgi:gliding motility-associated-like protein
VVTAAGGGDVTVAGTGPITPTNFSMTFTVTGGANHDVITITGLQIQPLTTTAPDGNIIASSFTNIFSIVPGAFGTNFGTLGLVDTIVTPTPFSPCTGQCYNLTNATPGGTWTSSNTTVGTISPIAGHLCFLATGTTTITYTVAGCPTSIPFSVALSPAPIVGVHNMCAWYDTLVVSDATTGGLYSSTGVTTFNIGGGFGHVHANAPSPVGSRDTIIYVTPNGCSSMAVLTVNPLPGVIQTPPYRVCLGLTDTLTDSPGPGTWTSSVTGVAIIGSSSGVLTGMGIGTTRIIYTITATGCHTDTLFTVNPVPNPITGPSHVCELSTITLTDLTTGGGWSVLDTFVASIDTFSGVLTGRHPGSTIVLYILPTGCETLYAVTVDPLPADITGPGQVCIGDSIQLFDATSGGKWYSTNTAIATADSLTGYITGVGVGSVVINYTTAAGCTKQYTVTVNPVPSPIGGPHVVCVGSFIVLTDTTTPGTWTSSNSAVGSVDAVSGVLIGVSTGTVTVCYQLPTGCSACVAITVNPTPGPITGPDTVCVGSAITLTVAGAVSGGIWTSSNPAVGSLDTTGGTITLYGESYGTVVISYTAGGCSATYVVTVDSLPGAIVGPSTVCQGDSVQLTDPTPGGTWTSSNLSKATVSLYTGWVTGIATGTVYITYTVPTGGCAIVLPMTVNAKDSITGSHTVCVGDSVTLANSIPNGLATWVDVGGHTALGNHHFTPLADANIIGLVPGVDTIYYTLPSGCVSVFIITVNPLSPIYGDSVVCVGSDAFPLDSTAGGLWSNTDTTILTINPVSGQVHGVRGGVDTIRYTITATGCTTWRLFTVNPIPTPIYYAPSLVICMGDTTRLFDSTAGGIWIPSNGNAIINGTGLVTGILAGYDTITYYLTATGCSVNIIVTVNQISPISGPDSVCVGNTIHLVDTSIGGTWSNIHPATGSINTLGNYTGIAPGVDTITYTMPSGCSAIWIVTVNPQPGPIIGPNHLCTGECEFYTNVAGPGVWTSSNPGVASIGSSTGVGCGVSVGVATFTYTLYTGGCFVTMDVTVNQTPPGPVGPTHICRGDTAMYTDALAGGTWSNPAPDLFILTVYGVVAHVNTQIPGTDTLIYTMPTGCSVGKTIVIDSIPVIHVVQPPIKCKYAAVVLNASGAGPTGTYTWSPAYGLSNTSGPTTVATPTVTTTYTVTGTTDPAITGGCDSFTVVTVFVDDSLNHLKIVGKDSICEGESDTLKGSGRAGSYFNWHPVHDLTCTICDTTIASPKVTTTYWAVAIDDIGCKDSVKFKVTVNPLPVIVESPNPVIVCKHIPMQVHMSTTNTDDLTTMFIWSPNLFLSCDTCNNPILLDTNNIVYNVTATTIYGCTDSFKVKVSVLDTNVNTISIDTNICIGTVATLIATSHSLYSNLDVPTFTWFPITNPATLDYPDSNFTHAFPGVTTTYSVAIRENACFSDTLSVTVNVQPYPAINLSPVSPDFIIAGTPTQLTAIVNNTLVKHYLWAPPQYLTCDTCYTTVAIPTVTTTYTVTVTSIYGCISVDSVRLVLGCDNSQVFIPNTFTPNGDGVNDIFYVSGKGLSIIKHFSVYNRWGQLLFEQHNIPPNNPGFGWDGTFKGLVLEPDVFVYIVEAQCELGGTPFKYKGDVSLVK